MAEKYKWVKHPEFPDDTNKNSLLYAEDGTNYRVSISRSDSDSHLYKQYQAWVAAGNTPEAAD
tara:strand:- start:1331 stop:1519 length:189 start_codon:yes stop_codon:yes gene_type:complete